MHEDYAVWAAVYDDGTIINQKELKVFYEDLDRDRLREFRLLIDGQVIVTVPFKPGQGSRLIWRRRVHLQPGGAKEMFYIVGKRSAFVSVVFPDGRVLIDDNFHEENVLWNDIAPVKGEEGFDVESKPNG